MNDFGYFKYSDFAIGAKENATYSCNTALQSGSSLTQLSVGVEPYDFASLEKDSYITLTPKKLSTANDELGLLTSVVSNSNAEFDTPIVLTSEFSGYYSMTGITINSRNIIQNITITAYQDNTVVKTSTFTASTNEFFYDFNVELVNKIVFTISKIDKVGYFFGIFNIEYGKVRIFDDSIFSDAEITNKCSIIGDTIEYDTLSLTINKSEDTNYLFQARQPLDYIYNGEVSNRFYIESGNEKENNTIKITAYDGISSLEDNFYGGLYSNYSFNSLIDDIMANSNLRYECVGTSNVTVSGYIPICSKRKALQILLLGSNIRLIKGSKFTFKALPLTSDGTYDESNVGVAPETEQNQEIKSITVLQHNYSKGTDESELYHWFISTTESKMITFSNPMHDLKAYEVVGVDEDGTDIISTDVSKNVTFTTVNANYCIVTNSSSNKIVIKGKNYIDSTVEFSKTNRYISPNEKYSEIKYEELTILTNAQSVCDYIYDLQTRKTNIQFITIVKPNIGGYYRILENGYNISQIRHNMDGLYETEAI